VKQNDFQDCIYDLLHDKNNLSHIEICNIITKVFLSDLIFITDTSDYSNNFLSTNKNYVFINNTIEYSTNEFNIYNYNLYSLLKNIYKPIIIEKYILENNFEGFIREHNYSELTNSIAYNYKSPCYKGIYFFLGFKKISPETLSNNIFLLKLLAPHICKYMNQSISGNESNDKSPLSIREKQTLKLFKIGLRPREICTKLHISERTVRFHMDNIVSKLNAKNKTHALSIALIKNFI